MHYFIYDNVGLMGCEFKPSPGQKQSAITFDSPVNGTLVISNSTFPVTNGEARVPTRLLAEAKQIVLTETGKSNVICLQAPSGSVFDIIRALAEGNKQKSNRIADLEKRVQELERYCLPNDNGLF